MTEPAGTARLLLSLRTLYTEVSRVMDGQLRLPDGLRPYPRQFVPPHAQMQDREQVEALMQSLRLQPIDTVELLEKWLLDVGELQACIAEELARLYLAMMRHIDDKTKEDAYSVFAEYVESRCRPLWHELDRRYVESPVRADLPRQRYQVYDRNKAASIRLHCPANMPLCIEETKLIQQYDTLCAGMTVQYDGFEQTLDQMYRYQLQNDRGLRQRAWELVTSRRLQESRTINGIFDGLLRVRSQVVRNTGFESFREYQFAKYNRFDYTPQDCVSLHQAVESLVVPLHRRLRARDDETRRQSLGVERLRPWDRTVDPWNRSPLRPFRDVDELCRKCKTIFSRIDPMFGDRFEALARYGWLDLDCRKGKASRGFTQPLGEIRCSFIFLNCTGVHDEVGMLLHEGGHALHDLACRDDPLFYYRNDYPLEMAEVAGHGIELLACDHLDVFYNEEDRQRVRQEQFESFIHSLPSICAVDAFQHWIYTAPEPEQSARSQHWYALQKRFGNVDPEAHRDDPLAATACRESWQQVGHLFRSPFYFIEYAIAQIGALQLWRNARADAKQAVRQFQQALSLGGSKPLPELWATAGLTFEFSESTLRSVIADVAREIDL